MMYTLPSKKIRRGCKYTATCKDKKEVYVRSYKTVYILYVSLGGGGGGGPTKHVVKIASLVVTWLLSLNLECIKHQRSGQVYHILLPILKKAYYSSQVSRVCVSSV